MYAGLLSSFIAFPFVGILYANRNIDGCCKRCFVVCCCLFLIILYVFIGLSKGDAFNWRYFSFYLIGAGIIFLFALFPDIDYKKNFIPLCGFPIAVYLVFILLYPEFFIEAFKRFLIAEGLAAKNVEIYLKNENKFVKGTLRFSDSKYAYVEYGDPKTICNPDDSEECKEIYPFRKRVPITDVTILNSLDTQTQAKK